jgi:hypothetical protein
MRHDFRTSTLDARRGQGRFLRHLAVLFAACALNIGALAVAMTQAPHAGAAGGDAIVHWDSSMIYPGQNNGNPYGPVGEHAIIHGENFQSYSGQNVKLKLIPGDINHPPGGSSATDMCNSSSTKISIGSAPVDGSGKFDHNFDWPSAANHGQYSVCVYQPDGSPAANFDDGPFTVLSSGRPSISISSGTVAAGSSLRVTGRNWVPPQTVHVLIGPCMFCDAAPIARKDVTSSGLNNGTFSVTIPIPAGTAPGQYSVGAFSSNGVLDVGFGGVRRVTVTPAATPTPSPTATSEATATTVGGAGGVNGSDNNGASNSGAGLLIGLIAGLIMLLLIVLIVAIVLLARRKPQPGGAPGAPGGYYPGAPGGAPAGYPPQGYPGYNTPPAAAPYAAPQQSPPQPDWGIMPQNWTPGETAMYPAGDDAPTRPSSFPPDADTFPPSGDPNNR